jgi:hypothetical protein
MVFGFEVKTEQESIKNKERVVDLKYFDDLF